MRRPSAAILLAGALLVVAVVLSPAVGQAQDTPPSTGVPAPDIVPQPNTGRAPTEAGDRGGTLQLLILGLVVVAVGGGVAHLTRQSRRARSTSPSP